MGLWLRCAVLVAVFCCLTVELGAGSELNYNDIMEGRATKEHQVRRRPVVRRPLARPGRRPNAYRPPAAPSQRRPASAPQRRPGRRPQGQRGGHRGARPATVRKPTYGSAQIALAGKPATYQYAQGKPQAHPVQVQRPAQRPVQHPVQRPVQVQAPPVKNQQVMAVSMPTLANLLYKYAAKSSQPIYTKNLYQNMFGRGTYGPMPKPTGYTPQHRQQQVSYQSPPQPQPKPVQMYRPVVAQQSPRPQYVTPAPTKALLSPCTTSLSPVHSPSTNKW